MKKINVGIFFGGCSPEYSVSLSSASGVILNVDQEKYNPVLIGITKKGEWYHYAGPVDKLLNDTWQNPSDCTPAVLSPNRGENCLILLGKEGVSRIPLDIAFPVLHGGNGEDGTLQGLLELSGIPVAGCGTLASALGMDKDRAHRLVGLEGVRVPMHLVLDPHTPMDTIESFAEKIGYPLFVKPVKAGSSYGVTKVACKEQLSPALALAFQYDSQALLEENIPGFEVGRAGQQRSHRRGSGRNRTFRRFLRFHGEVYPEDLSHPCTGEDRPCQGGRDQGESKTHLPGAGLYGLCPGGHVPDS